MVYYQEGSRTIPVMKGDQSHSKHFTYLYESKVATLQRANQEYSLLNLETGKFKAHNQLEMRPHKGVKAQYTIGKSLAPRYWVTLGDQQSNAKVISHVYHSKKAAEKRLKRELPKLNARRNMIQQVKIHH